MEGFSLILVSLSFGVIVYFIAKKFQKEDKAKDSYWENTDTSDKIRDFIILIGLLIFIGYTGLFGIGLLIFWWALLSRNRY